MILANPTMLVVDTLEGVGLIPLERGESGLTVMFSLLLLALDALDASASLGTGAAIALSRFLQLVLRKNERVPDPRLNLVSAARSLTILLLRVHLTCLRNCYSSIVLIEVS